MGRIKFEVMGMGAFRGLVRIAGSVLLSALVATSIAPLLAAVVDRGPDGRARLSAFPMALASFDPFVRECALHSLIVAGLVAGGSLVLGVGLAQLAGSRRCWGRAPLVLLANSSMAAGPLLIAPGVLLLMGGPGGWDWLAARSFLGWSAEDAARWSALVWVGLAWGTPVVAIAAESALRRIEPAWSEAARAAGASPLRSWLDLAWPILRPEASRGAATVFTLALVEPAGPMVLGLRRTLAVAILEAANRLDQPTRAATLAVLAILIAILGRAAILRWGGPSYLRPGPGPMTPPGLAGRARSLATLLLLGFWSAMTAGPVLVLLWRLSEPTRGVALGAWARLSLAWLAESEPRRFAANAATVGALAVGVDLLILRAIAGQKPGISGWLVRRFVSVFELVPPLALAVGALSLPWLIRVVADLAGGSLGSGLGAIALEASPARWPGLPLIAALAVGRLPTLIRAVEIAGDHSRPARADSALLMGASRRKAIRESRRGRPGIAPTRPVILSLALASTALAPALLLAPGSEGRTLAPAVLGRILESSPDDPRLFGPAATVLVINLFGFALASRGRSGPIGNWFRG